MINYFSFKNKNKRVYPILYLLLLFSVCSFAQEVEPVSDSGFPIEKNKEVNKVNTVKIPAHRKTAKITKIQSSVKSNKTVSDHKKDLGLCKTKLQKINELDEFTASQAKYVHAKKELTKKIEELELFLKEQNFSVEK